MDDQPIAIDVRNAEIDGVLQDIIDRVHGLKAVLISTNDGVPLVQVSTQAGDSEEEAAVAEATAPEHLAYLQVCLLFALLRVCLALGLPACCVLLGSLIVACWFLLV